MARIGRPKRIKRVAPAPSPDEWRESPRPEPDRREEPSRRAPREPDPARRG